jgi:hypothetical protein
VSWYWRSTGTDDRITPVTPPITNSTTKPTTNSIGVAKRTRPAQMVAIQPKICTPLGRVMIALAAVKKVSPSCGRGVANMWWTHSPNDRKPVATIDSTIAE